MTSRPYDAADNSRRGYQLGLKAWREACIRRKQILPDPDRPDEVRWAAEGERPSSQLDTVREAPNE